MKIFAKLTLIGCLGASLAGCDGTLAGALGELGSPAATQGLANLKGFSGWLVCTINVTDGRVQAELEKQKASGQANDRALGVTGQILEWSALGCEVLNGTVVGVVGSK